MYLYQLQENQSTENQLRLSTLGSELLNKAITDLRSLSHTMNAQWVSKNNLEEVLRQELEYINSAKGAQCRLDVQGDPEELSADRQTLLFRILQEGIGNALKHAQAEHIIVGLKYGNGRLTASISDDGRGMPDTHQDRVHTGLGFTNMQLRAKLLGGKLFVESKPRQGTKLWLTIAINPS
jgi:signal transduction histidine kinase